jgi:hypothetical protein
MCTESEELRELANQVLLTDSVTIQNQGTWSASSNLLASKSMSMILTSSTLLVQFQNQIKSLEKSRLLNLATSLATLIVSRIKIAPINDVTSPNRPTRDQAMRIRIGNAPQEGGAIGIDRRSNNVNS